MDVDQRAHLEDIKHATYNAPMTGADDWIDDDDEDAFGRSYDLPDAVMMDEVLRGDRVMEPSHYGGEFQELLHEMAEELKSKQYVLIDFVNSLPPNEFTARSIGRR